MTAEQLASLDGRNTVILTSQLMEGRLKKIMFGSQLYLTLVDGSELKLFWRSADNHHELVKGLLRQAFGLKLVDEDGAA